MALTTIPTLNPGDIGASAWMNTYVRDNINGLIGLGGARNLLVNGGFEINQRGAGPFTANGAYTLDRWAIGLGAGSAISVTPETTTIDARSTRALKAVYTHSAGSYLLQRIEGVAALQGQTLTFSCRVNQSVASAVAVGINDSGTLTTSAGSATTGSYTTLSVSATIGASASFVEVALLLGVSGTHYFDNAVLAYGAAALAHTPLHPQEDLARCQRYYEVMGGVSSTLFLRGYQAAGAVAGTTLFYRVTKGGTPTVTKNGTWAVTNCAQPAVGAPSVDSCNLTTTVTALGDFSFSPNSADDTVTVEFNPA